jgi:CBS domain-containing protein
MAEQTGTANGSDTSLVAALPELSLEFSRTELKVEDFMTGTVITVSPEETVSAAIREMAKYRISCVIVTVGGKAVGILTERDVLRGIAARYDEFVKATVAEEMSEPVISVLPSTTALAASKLMACKKIKRLLVASQQQPVGVVTQTDIASALISMAPFRNIADLMTHEVVWTHETATVAEAAQLMAASDISCIAILRDGKVVGVVTEKDVLQRVARSAKDPAMVQVAEIMSSPVTTVPPTHSVMSASRIMDQMRIHRLLVGSTTDVQGIVTQTDVIEAVQEKLEEARQVRQQQKAEMVLLVSSATAELSSIHEFCLDVLGAKDTGGEPAASDAVLEELETRFAQTRESLQRLAGVV